jgi:hypothetical protein
MNYPEHIRDIKLNLLMSENTITIDSSKRKGKLTFLRPGYSLIKQLIKMGAIVTGSRALRCYNINGKQLFDRKPRDWDFLVTERMAMKICDEHGVTYKDGSIMVLKQMILFRDSCYGDTRYFTTDIQLIVKDELPEYREVDGIRFSELSHIIDEKHKLVSPHHNSISGIILNKHDEDLRQIIARFNNL